MSAPHKPEKLLPTSVRFTAEERAQVESHAAGMSLSDYIRMRVLDPDAPTPQRRNKVPVKDHSALAKALALLGASRVPNNLNQLARANNSGSLVLTPDIASELREALRHIWDIRQAIFTALGISAR